MRFMCLCSFLYKLYFPFWVPYWWSIIQYPTSITTERNATGHVVRADGVQTHMIELLSQMLNFRLVNNRINIIILVLYYCVYLFLHTRRRDLIRRFAACKRRDFLPYEIRNMTRLMFAFMLIVKCCVLNFYHVTF